MSKKRTPGQVAIERDLISSPAYLSLTGTAPQVLLLFLSRRVFERRKTQKKKRGEWVCTNADQLSVTYSEAEGLGINGKRFTRAIDQLIEKGFLDITHPGGMVRGDVSRYGLSERWRLYGTTEFQPATRPKDDRWIGYRERQRSEGGDRRAEIRRWRGEE